MQYVKENLVTVEEAETLNCLARNQDLPCIAAACMAWRWMPLLATDPKYIAAVKKCDKMQVQENGRLRKMRPGEAAAHVNENRSKFGLPEKPFEGYCGLAGNP